MRQHLSCKMRLRYYKYVVLSWLHRQARKLNVTDGGFCCGADGPCFRIGTRRRQNTAYCDDERNWIIACPECFEAIEERWRDLWSDMSR
jgi:hypothetical protein